MIARNGVLNRTVIELLGYHPYAIGLARNRYERLERFLDIGCWVAAAIGIPVVLEKVFNGFVTRNILAPKFSQSFIKGAKIRPFEIPFEWLDKSGFAARMKTFQRDPQKLKMLQKIGIKSFSQLTPQLGSALLLGKIGIMLTDYFFMAVKGQGYSWGKNYLTQRLSKQHGFSGEFGFTDETFRLKQTQDYQRQERRKLIRSLLIGFGGACLTPLLVWQLLKNPHISMQGKGPLSFVKRLIPVLNPYKGVFMSTWGLLPHNIFNWNIPAVLAARDGNELRELLVRAVVFDFFYFIGDGLFAGMSSRYFQHRYGHALKNIKINGKPIAFTAKGFLGLPMGVSFGDIYHQLEDGNLRQLPGRPNN